jgi:hypothetical protein
VRTTGSFLDRLQERVGRPQAAGEHDAGGRGERARRVGEQRRQHDVGAISGRDQQRAVGQPPKRVGRRPRRHQHAERLATERLGAAADEVAVVRREDFPVAGSPPSG